jgi:hypothetical protein
MSEGCYGALRTKLGLGKDELPKMSELPAPKR